LKLSESENLDYIGMNNTIQKKATFLFLPLPLVEEPKDKEEKPKATDLIEFILKQQAGSTSSAPTYKLKVLRRDCFRMDLLQEGHCGALEKKRLT
jgi:hypothetical protein